MCEMRDSGFRYLGALPSTWPTRRLKHFFVVSRVTGRADATVLSLYRDHGIVPKDSRDDNHNVTSLDTSKYKYVEVGDFVINKMKGWQGSMALSGYEGIVSPAYHVFKITTSNLVPSYAHYLLRCQSYADEWRRLSTGLRIGQWDLHVEDFLNASIPVPPIDEQQRIADYLDDKCAEIDRAIEAAEKSIEEYESYRRSLVTYGTACKRTSKRVRLRNLCSRIFDGPFGSHLKNTDYIDEGIRVVRLENLKYMRFDDSKQSFISHEKYKTISRHTVTPDDLIMATFVAKEVQVVELPSYVEFAVNKADCVGLRLNGIACKRFVQYALSSNAVLGYLQGQLHGTTRGRVNTSQIKTIPLALPPLDEQRRIVDYLDDKCVQIDRAIAAKQAIIADLKAYKQSLIYEVVTGKREV